MTSDIASTICKNCSISIDKHKPLGIEICQKQLLRLTNTKRLICGYCRNELIEDENGLLECSNPNGWEGCAFVIARFEN